MPSRYAHTLNEQDHANYLAALALPMPSTVAKTYKAAMAGYETALRLYETARDDEAKAARINKNADNTAAAKLADMCQGGRLASMPADIVAIVKNARNDLQYATDAKSIMIETVHETRKTLEKALHLWGPETTVWAATQRVAQGPHVQLDEFTQWIMHKAGGPMMSLPIEAQDEKNPNTKRTTGVLIDPVGVSWDKHPQRNGKRNHMGGVDHIPADNVRAYQLARQWRLVQYWACCALVDGQAQHDGKTWRITANYSDTANVRQLFANYCGPQDEQTTTAAHFEQPFKAPGVAFSN